jgi:hypothetical protein
LKNTEGKIVMERPSVSGVIHFLLCFYFLIQKLTGHPFFSLLSDLCSILCDPLYKEKHLLISL